MDHWEIVKSQAIKCYESNTEWTSFIERRRYKISKVEVGKVIIARLSGGEDAELGIQGINNAINKLKGAGRLKSTALISAVARQVALVYLHPFIHWDNATREIYWKEVGGELSVEGTIGFIKQAKDDELEKILVEVNKRQNQSVFRDSLLKLYNSRCAISEVNTGEVLEAAHILAHSDKGINSVENGILLRRDLHRLFDRNLLLIHPKKLTVHISPAIKDPEYKKYDGKKLLQRIDSSRPAEEFLSEKWTNADWGKAIR